MSANVPLVSIILPIYNSKSRIGRCLDSLLNQSLREIEVVAVLDCPTDDTAQIVKEYAAKDSRIVVVENTKNLHIGESRNEGLFRARGKYIGFSDHDDYRELNMYELLVQVAERDDADMVFSPIVYEEGTELVRRSSTEYSTFGNIKNDCLSDLIGNGNNQHYESLFINIQGCIYRRSFIDENNIRFVDTRQITPEDVIFQIESFSCANKISILPQFLYYHIAHDKNEGKKLSYKSVYSRGLGLEYIYNYLKGKGIFEVYRNEFYTRVQKRFIDCLARTLYPFPRLVQFVRTKRYLRSFVFCKDAFEFERVEYDKRGAKRLFRKLLVKTLQ